MNPGSGPHAAVRRKPGCLFYGCLSLVLLALILGGAAGLGLWIGLKKFNQTVADYTASTPIALPAVNLSDADYQALETRFSRFGADLEQGKAAEPLLLTGDEINALLTRSQALEAWRGRVHVFLDGDQVRGQVSLPLDPIAHGPILRRLEGRYLNGAAQLRVGMEAGRIAVRLVAMEVNGRMIPVEIMQRLQTLNLTEAAYQDPQNASLLGRIRDVQVNDGRLVVTPASAP